MIRYHIIPRIRLPMVIRLPAGQNLYNGPPNIKKPGSQNTINKALTGKIMPCDPRGEPNLLDTLLSRERILACPRDWVPVWRGG